MAGDINKSIVVSIDGDPSKLNKAVGDAKEKAEKDPIILSVEASIGGVKDILGKIKSEIEKINKNGLNIDTNKFQNTLNKIDSYFEKIQTEAKEGIQINPEVNFKGLETFEQNLKEISKSLDIIANKSKTTFELKGQKEQITNTLKGQIKDLKEAYKLTYDSDSFEVNLNSEDFRKQASEIIRISKMTKTQIEENLGSLAVLFNTKKIPRDFTQTGSMTGSLYTFMQTLSAHMANNGKLNAPVNTLQFSHANNSWESGKTVTIQQLIDALNKVFSTMKKPEEASVYDAVERIMDSKDLKQRLVPSGIIKNTLKAGQSQTSLGDINAELKEAEAREAKFSKEAVENISKVADALNKFIVGEGQGLERITEAFEGINTAVTELQETLSKIDFEEIMAQAAQAAKKTSDTITDTAKVVSANTPKKQGVTIKQTVNPNGSTSYTSDLGVGQQVVTRLRTDAKGNTVEAEKLVNVYEKLEKEILKSKEASYELKQALDLVSSVRGDTSAIKALEKIELDRRRSLRETLGKMRDDKSLAYTTGDYIEFIKKEIEINKLKDLERQKDEAIASARKTQTEQQKAAMQKEAEEYKRLIADETRVLEIEKEMHRLRNDRAIIKQNNGDISVVKDRLEALKLERNNTLGRIKRNKKYDPEWDNERKALEEIRVQEDKIQQTKKDSIRATKEAEEQRIQAAKEAAKQQAQADKEAKATADYLEKQTNDIAEKIAKITSEIKETESVIRSLNGTKSSTTENVAKKNSLIQERDRLRQELEDTYISKGLTADDAESAFLTKYAGYKAEVERQKSAKDASAKATQEAKDAAIAIEKQAQAVKELDKAQKDASKSIQKMSDEMKDMASSGKYTDSFNKKLEKTATILDSMNRNIGKNNSIDAIGQKLNNAQKMMGNMISGSKDASNIAFGTSNKDQANLTNTVNRLDSLRKKFKELSLDTVDLGGDIVQVSDRLDQLETALRTADSAGSFEDARNGLKLFEEQTKKAITRAEELAETVKKSDDYVKKIQQIGEDLGKMSAQRNKTGDYKYTDKFRSELSTASSNWSSFQKGSQSLDELAQAYDKAREAKKRFAEESNYDKNVKAQTLNIEKLRLKIEQFAADNSAMGSKFKQQFDILLESFNKISQSKGDLSGITNEFFKLETAITKAGKTGKSFFDTLQGRIKQMSTNFIAMYFSLYDIIRYTKELFNTVKEFDSALTEMRKVSDESIKTLQSYQIQSFKTADSVGTTALALQKSAADWMRLGRAKAFAPLYSNVY